MTVVIIYAIYEYIYLKKYAVDFVSIFITGGQ